jgi:excinuclease ABC subunit C
MFSPNEVSELPHEPGVYKFFNDRGEMIYVGKAKDLRKRVSSYFTKQHGTNRKTFRLISEIRKIDFVVSNSEFDALLLENNLIKENQPKYNILLKDDKSFPFICVTRERFPRIFSTRRYDTKIGDYYGPYSSVVAMKNVLDLVRKLNTIRTCKYNLSEENVRNKKYKLCLEYHLGNCKGPCEDLQSEEDYLDDVNNAVEILKGNIGIVKKHFSERMNQYAAELKFELAQEFKEKLDYLEKFQAKSLVVNPRIEDVDVFTINSDDTQAYVNYLKIINGAIVNSQNQYIRKKLEESDEDILSMVVYDYRLKTKSKAKEVITSIPLSIIPEDLENTIPKIGDKKKLIELSFKNLFLFKQEKLKSDAPVREKKNETLLILQKDLRLKSVPNHIECFDNSNLQGTNPVASMVCFKNGKPAKKEYRHFNIKSVEGPDDFASMNEVVFRRYKRLLDEASGLPDLIVVDGGKGQLSAACEALKTLGIYGEVPVIGIAKRLEEIYYPGDSFPLHINKASPGLKLIQQLRDEAHRFAITFHRNQRSRGKFSSSLTNIEGIGPSTADALLRKFKSVKKISEAPIEELAKVVGTHKAEIIKENL